MTRRQYDLCREGRYAYSMPPSSRKYTYSGDTCPKAQAFLGSFIRWSTFYEKHEAAHCALAVQIVAEVAERVTTGKVATTWPRPPYADLDGDGQYEIVVSMFNSEGEGQWLIRGYDVMTGALKYGAPGLIAVAVLESGEVLANACEDATQSVLRGAHFLRVTGGNLATVQAKSLRRRLTATCTSSARPGRRRTRCPRSCAGDPGPGRFRRE